MTRQEPPVYTATAREQLWHIVHRRGQLRLHHGRLPHASQVAALHLRDSYFRLSYGPGCGWGTSVMLMPALWSRDRYHHGVRVTAMAEPVGPNLRMDVRGVVAGLDVHVQVDVEPPTGKKIVAEVRAQLRGDGALDLRPGEAFKPVFLSSMRISVDQWDCCTAEIDGTRVLLPPDGWIVPPDAAWEGSSLGLTGGSCAWKEAAPTLRVEQLSPALPITGWVTASTDPNDDNVGLWAAADHILGSWRYRIVAARA